MISARGIPSRWDVIGQKILEKNVIGQKILEKNVICQKIDYS